jgi:hypothetical protein
MKRRVLVKMTSFHAFKKEEEANGAVWKRTREDEAIIFPCNATISLSLPSLAQKYMT